jgi:hypothetical protein
MDGHLSRLGGGLGSENLKKIEFRRSWLLIESFSWSLETLKYKMGKQNLNVIINDLAAVSKPSISLSLSGLS